MPGGAVLSGGGIGTNAPKNPWAGIIMTSFAAFGGILYGYDTGTISGIKAMPDWLKTFGHPVPVSTDFPDGFGISSSQESLVVSILSAGTFFGALFGAPVADIIGRKFGVVFSCIIFCVGVAMQTASTAIPLFSVGRVFAGLGVGLISTLIPMYQSECSPKWIRGAVVSAYQWAITIGLLLAAIVNNATKNRPNHSSYRIPIAIQFVWAFILSVGMFFLPESPRWLIKRGSDAAAARSLSRLTSLPESDPVVVNELNEIRENLAAEEALGEHSYIDCFRFTDNKICFRTMTGIVIQAMQQLTGVNFVFYYGTTFFQNSGFTDPFLIQVITNVVNVVMTLPGMWGVERFGRRRLLLIGAVCMCVSEFLVAILGVTVSTENKSGQKAIIAFVCLFIASFAATWGPIAWVLIGEIFPLNVRAKALSLSAASNWLWNFGIAYATPYLVNEAPGSAGLKSNVYFIWGSCCALCFVFTFFCVPETKGLSLEQIDALYMNTTPIKSVAYRRQLLLSGQDLGAAPRVDDSKTHDVDSLEKV